LQTELAEEKSQSLHSQKLRHEKKVVFLNVIKKFCMQARNILTNSSLARPETPSQTLHHHVKSFILRVLLAQQHKIYLRLNQNAQRWIIKKVPSYTFNTKRMCNKT